MSATFIAFFNNKGGVGKTSLVYHLDWMYADLGAGVVAADLDPQANLTAAFLDEDRLEELWPDSDHRHTAFGCVQPLIQGLGDIADPHLEYVVDEPAVADQLALVVGDLALSGFEDELSAMWPDCLDRKERAFRVISAFWRILQRAATLVQAEIVLIDLGPTLGAMNRAALIAADYVVVPLAPDLFSLRGLSNLGPTLRRWRAEWRERRVRNPVADLALPKGRVEPVGYIILQHAVRLDRPVQAYDRWVARIPGVYRSHVLHKSEDREIVVTKDPHCLALLKHYRSLMPLAQEARKPIFHLKPADGAMGAHVQAVHGAYHDFKALARIIAQRTGVALP